MKHNSDLQLPDVLHIGFSKSASTFLQAIFKTHPQIHFVYKTYFYAPLSDCNYGKGLKYYKSFFENAEPDQVKIESDEHLLLPLIHPTLKARATTIDSLKTVFERIKLTNPNVKLIIVLRRHEDLIVSRYSQYILGGGKLTIEEFWEEMVSCSTDGINYFQNYYFEIINVLYSYFSKENILIISQKLLKQNQSTELARLYSFLNLNPIKVSNNFIKMRIGLSPNGMYKLRIINKLLIKQPEYFGHKFITLCPVFLYKNFTRVLRVYDKLFPNRIRNKKEVLPKELKNEINLLFADDTNKLKQIYKIEI